METEKREKPCCAAEALRRVRRIEVGGVVVGLAMLDAVPPLKRSFTRAMLFGA